MSVKTRVTRPQAVRHRPLLGLLCWTANRCNLAGRPTGPAGQASGNAQIRYLVHPDGGSGMRYRSEPLTVGVELADGAARYRVERVERVEPPPNPNAFGHACVSRLDGS